MVLTLFSIQNFIILPNDSYQVRWGELSRKLDSFHDMATRMERLDWDSREWRGKIDSRQGRDLFTLADLLHCTNYCQGPKFSIHSQHLPVCLSALSGEPLFLAGLRGCQTWRKLKDHRESRRDLQVSEQAGIQENMLMPTVYGDSHCFVCGSETSWLLELRAGSTSTVRPWIRL